MIAAAPIVALLLSLHTCAREPQNDARRERVTMIAESIAEVSDNVDDAAGLIAIAVAESSLCEDVHAGTRKGGSGEGLWQLEPGSRRHGPFSGLDREATTHAAGEALWLWRHTRTCRSLAARFGAYAGLDCKAWSGAALRVKLYGRTMRVIVDARRRALHSGDNARSRLASKRLPSMRRALAHWFRGPCPRVRFA